MKIHVFHWHCFYDKLCGTMAYFKELSKLGIVQWKSSPSKMKSNFQISEKNWFLVPTTSKVEARASQLKFRGAHVDLRNYSHIILNVIFFEMDVFTMGRFFIIPKGFKVKSFQNSMESKSILSLRRNNVCGEMKLCHSQSLSIRMNINESVFQWENV